jgi:hypothetical protein
MHSIQELKDIIKYCKETHESTSPCPYLLRSFAFYSKNKTIEEINEFENNLRIKYYEEELVKMLEKQ